VLEGQIVIISHHVSSKIIVAIFAVEQQQVAKRLGRKRWLPHEPIHFFETLCGLLLHVHERAVVQRHGI